MKNLYEILGVKENASNEEIRKAYKSKAQKMHPDKSGDLEGFKELQVAYKILSDKEKREYYDLTGNAKEYQDKDANVNNALSQLFMKIISDETKGDIIEIAKKEINASIDSSNFTLNKIVNEINKLNSYLNRVINKNGINVYESSLNENILSIKDQKNQIEEVIELSNIMLKKLENYTDLKPDIVEKQNKNNSHFFDFNVTV